MKQGEHQGLGFNVETSREKAGPARGFGMLQGLEYP